MFTYLKKRGGGGGDERSSHCLFLRVHRWGLEDHRVRKKFKLPEILLGMGHLKR